MSHISEKHKKSLQNLIYSEDFENVLQGLELLDTLAENENDIYFVFNLHTKLPTNIEDLEKEISDVTFHNYIKVWILGKLAELEISWVLKLTYLKIGQKNIMKF